jgi:transcription factor MBP1
VYEYNAAPGVHIMRRRVDDWINATHILKAAGFDKPARTRILEREVQKGVHEKVQGGYGKYQGIDIKIEIMQLLNCQVHGFLSTKVGLSPTATG